MCLLCIYRYVVQLTAEHDYFFFLYLGYVGCQTVLAAIALFHYPGHQDMQILDLPDQTEYSVSTLCSTLCDRHIVASKGYH